MMRSTLVATLVLAAIGCGGGDPTVREVFEAAVDPSCEHAFECRAFYPDGGFLTFEDVYGTSVAECKAMFRALIEDGIAEYEAAIAAGRIIFDGGAAEICVEHFAATACDRVWAEDTAPPECDQAFQGTVPVGGACTLEEECAGGEAYCDSATGVCA